MVPDRHMDPYFAEFVPMPGPQEPKAHLHPGAEFLYVLDGELTLQHGDNHCILGPGDAVYFDSSTAHSYTCHGPKPASALIVAMHQAPAPPSQARSAFPPGPRPMMVPGSTERR
jgi:quercetin dioxygenase-like cupin family protein